MLMYILIGVSAIVLILIAIVAAQPADFKVSRSMKMGASPSAVFPLVNELHNWKGWSPWAKLDPNQQVTITDPSSGVGASHSWNGNNNVGEGKMTIVDCQPEKRVGIKLEFQRPFKCNNDVEFVFQREGDGTFVTWTMTGRNGFMGKLMGLMMNMDKMCGGQFEEGLTGIKQIAETSAAKG